MSKALELTGQRFGRLTVVDRNPVNALSGGSRWNCVCDCGNRSTVIGSSLTNKDTLSCGCYQKEITQQLNYAHGLSGTPEYNSWHSMKERCYNVDHEYYYNYGGRGITVCDRWLNSFEAFYEDMGPRPSLDHSIDRENTDGNYEKDNCKWSTRKEQSNNRKSNRFYEYEGEIKTLMQWSESVGINYDTLKRRIYRGLTFEAAITTPVNIRDNKIKNNIECY
jgi:hypothetical protein